MTWYHGGIAGLRAGDLITPGVDGQRRNHAGCPTCEARNRGESPAVDAVPEQHGVYITSDREYARYYASMAVRGDLYVVELVGETTPSMEDRFPTAVAPAARVVAVYERAVQLTDAQRYRLYARWTEADADAEGWGDRFRAMSPADRRQLVRREYAAMIRRTYASARGR